MLEHIPDDEYVYLERVVRIRQRQLWDLPVYSMESHDGSGHSGWNVGRDAKIDEIVPHRLRSSATRCAFCYAPEIRREVRYDGMECFVKDARRVHENVVGGAITAN